MKSNSQRGFPRIKPFIKWVRVSDNEIKAYDPSSCLYNTVQNDSARVWELLDGEHSITQIAAILTKDMGVEDQVLDQVSQQVLVFLEALEKAGMIDYHDAPTPESCGVRAEGRKKETHPTRRKPA
jgi:hypothetical protein